MLIPKQNRLLPILATIVLLMLLLVLGKSCQQEPSDSVMLERVPQATAPDADTPADTIKTLTANVAAMTAELQQLRQVNKRLQADNQQVLNQSSNIEARVATRIDEEFAAREKQQSPIDSPALTSLSHRVDALSAAVSSSFSNLSTVDLPVGLGLEASDTSAELVWIEPLDAPVSDLSDGLLQRVAARSRTTSADFESNVQQLDAPTPAYTVPRNATLMGATAMTALLGRVPVRGEVLDPMPFKVITGADNLAANGLMVPGVAGMIWSGTAIGDWTLSCVTGRLESVTFVFDDGSIRTISSDDRDNQSGDANRPLGWISDARGIPCISGQRKSNAAAFLTQRIGIKAIEAAAEAAAASQTTTVIRDSGAITGNVTGSTGRFVLGRTLSRGSREIADWLLERQAQSFDVVYVSAGTELAIHVDRELSIDREPNARRLSYATATKNTGAHRLD